MNISKYEQRVLHALAQGGQVRHLRDHTGRISLPRTPIRGRGRLLYSRWVRPRRLHVCGVPQAEAAQNVLGLIASRDGQPYRITRAGLEAVRAQLDNG